MSNAKSVDENNTAESGAGDDLGCQALVWKHTFAVMDTMVLKCALKLDLFGAIQRHGGHCPISLQELAASLLVPPNRLHVLHRLLRYLAHMRLVDIRQEDSYTLTAASFTYLRAESEKSHAPYVRFLIEEDMLAALYGLDAFLVSGDDDSMSPFELMKGEPYLEWVARDPAVTKRFNDGMVGTVRPVIEAVLEGCPDLFNGVNILVDVGGGTGMMAAAIAKAFPSIRCIVYDLPHVVKEAPETEGVKFEAGDMDVSVPQADAWLFVRVLHYCADEKALQILSRCREAIAEKQGKLIIVDIVIDENDTEDLRRVKLAADMLMLAYFNGLQRTEKEWRSLLFKAGFVRCSITRVMALQYVIEASP